jgi:uncharacterized LabA/DUF88 family protein
LENEKRIAVLIDADNVSQKYIKHILDEIANYGIVTYKRIYGDWTKPQLNSWKELLLEHSVTPIQQYSYTIGKNSTDSALIIDAMDILYSGSVEGFCIVSSDSDFTRLAARLREAGMFVMGMGEKKTPRPFVAACEKFKYLEALYAPIAPVEPAGGQVKAPAAPVNNSTRELTESVRSIVAEISDEDGWASMGEVGTMLNKRYPDFDTRNYGFSKLTPLVSSLKVFEIISRRTNAHSKSYFIKNREQ